MRKTLNIVMGIAGGALVAIVTFIVLDYFFKGVIPDCAPNQIDGQCGLATFLQEIYSGAGAIVVWPIVAFFLSRYLLRRSARKTAHSK
jgi:hypothetical protein